MTDLKEVPRTWPKRFASKIRIAESGCWEWTASKQKHGYGRYGRGRRGEGWTVAHRVSYVLAHGPIPDGLDIDHLCRNKGCVNPAHLEAVTRQENVRRGDAGNRDGLCKRGLHPWVPENIVFDGGKGNGMRRCRECRNASQRERYRRRKERAA